jgi:hypothetical protein
MVRLPIPARIEFAALACMISLACGGCAHKKVQAAAPVAAAPQPIAAEMERPMNIAPDTTALPPPEEVAPPPAIPASNANTPPVSLPKAKPAPAPRKPAADPPATEPAADQPTHPSAPQILPQLSASDLEAYQRRTNEDIGIAEQNLHQSDGKQLSAAQKDLVEKITSFLEQSRDAIKGGDWTRAQTLAQKARLLSFELVSSL